MNQGRAKLLPGKGAGARGGTKGGLGGQEPEGKEQSHEVRKERKWGMQPGPTDEEEGNGNVREGATGNEAEGSQGGSQEGGGRGDKAAAQPKSAED